MRALPQSLLVLVCALASIFASSQSGAKLYNEFVDANAIYQDQRWQSYVDDIGNYLKRHTGWNKRIYYFVLDSPEVNAFATPDGYIFVNTGLLAFLDSEDQLAAIIGHEIGHVIAGHGRRQKTSDLLGKTAGIAATLLTGRMEMMQVSDAATRALIAGYGREMELEADKIGADLLAKSGYNPQAIIDTLHVLKDQAQFAADVRGQPSAYHGLFASHPQNDKRLHEIVQTAFALLPDELREPREDIWSLLKGLKFGGERQSGLLKPHVFFERSTRLVIEYPPDWQVRYAPPQVIGEDPKGADVGWISVTRYPRGEDFEHEKFVTETLKRTDIESSEDVQVGPYMVHLYHLTTTGSRNLTAILGIVERGSDIFAIRGEAGADGDRTEFRADFDQVVQGIRDLRPSDLQQDVRASLQIVMANPGDTYQSLATNSAIRTRPVDTLRLINGDYPSGEPRPGDYIKIIQ